MKEKLVIVASLFIHPGREAEFEQFETNAESIMRRYGGQIERRIGFPSDANPDRPHEVHIVTFPDEQSFARYRTDSDLLTLADLRAQAIRLTTVWMGRDLK